MGSKIKFKHPVLYAYPSCFSPLSQARAWNERYSKINIGEFKTTTKRKINKYKEKENSNDLNNDLNNDNEDIDINW